MPEYIEREAILKHTTSVEVGAFSEWDVVKVEHIKNAPTVDAVEVVRCSECKHFCPYEGEEHKGDCAELVGLESCVYEDDFCSYGERRSEE